MKKANTSIAPKTLADVRDGLCSMYTAVMNDRRMVSQVHEGSNALGKVVSATKVYLEACKLGAYKPNEEWEQFINGPDKPKKVTAS